MTLIQAVGCNGLESHLDGELLVLLHGAILGHNLDEGQRGVLPHTEVEVEVPLIVDGEGAYLTLVDVDVAEVDSGGLVGTH